MSLEPGFCLEKPLQPRSSEIIPGRPFEAGFNKVSGMLLGTLLLSQRNRCNREARKSSREGRLKQVSARFRECSLESGVCFREMQPRSSEILSENLFETFRQGFVCAPWNPAFVSEKPLQTRSSKIVSGKPLGQVSTRFREYSWEPGCFLGEAVAAAKLGNRLGEAV